MVKNTSGGSGHKSLARKMVSSGKANTIRLSQDPSELYGTITKMFGNGMCQVRTEKNEDLMCHIRGKFRGRNKKQNVVSINSTVLVGLREWETPVKNCDLLEIYEHDQLNMIPYSYSIQTASSSANITADELIFSESAEQIDDISKNNAKTTTIAFGDEIDIDDI